MLTIDTKRSIETWLRFPIKTVIVVHKWVYILFYLVFMLGYLIWPHRYWAILKKKKLSFLFMFDFFILGLFGAGHYENEGLCKCTILSAESTYCDLVSYFWVEVDLICAPTRLKNQLFVLVLGLANDNSGIVRDLHIDSVGEFEGAENCPTCLIVSWNWCTRCLGHYELQQLT